MNAVEFRTKIKNGMIVIPEKYKKKVMGNNVKVILLVEDASDADSDIIEELLESPLKLSGFRPFKREEIYDRTRKQ